MQGMVPVMSGVIAYMYYIIICLAVCFLVHICNSTVQLCGSPIVHFSKAQAASKRYLHDNPGHTVAEIGL